MPSFSWLHLTDLHYGLSGQAPLWPNVKESFFEDLARLHERTGPWHLVLFSGDLVQQGAKEEFAKLEEQVLAPLWGYLKTLGSEPHLLAVPGNHDLSRPDAEKPAAALRQLLRRDGFGEIADEFFHDPIGEYRDIINTAFAEYAAWWHRTPYRLPNAGEGILPGEFGATVEIEGKSVGIVGLNTTFLQLAGGDYSGRLAWDVRQFHGATTGDGPEWVKQHDLCLLMTHQGPEWLDKTSRESVYPEINPAGRFAVHLFGHMHQNVVRGSSIGGGKILCLWQGNSLFGMEKFGDPPSTDRRHGYSVGTLDFDGNVAKLRQWPRKAVRDANGWRFERDTDSCVLEESDGATKPVDFPLTAGRKRPDSSETSHPRPTLSISERQSVEIYSQAARKQWDIVDLAGLPEDDRHLAMQQFLLRQLFVPLRLVVESTASADLSDEEIEKIEKRRLSRGISNARAGRQAQDPEKFSIGQRLRVSASTPIKRARKARPRPAVEPSQPSVPRIVILGDPGGGKTTLMRWLATALLMRRAQDPDLSRLPDADTLPDRDWLPILVRCRDLDKASIASRKIAMSDVLRQALTRLELHPTHVSTLVEVFHRLVESGEVIVLLDGLDEITDPQLRAQFCAWIEGTARSFPSPMVTTSRIVGYREMKRRLGAGFEHATLADLSPEDKDDFVRRWCEVTVSEPARRMSEIQKLTEAVHGRQSDRIERLTGNPMLLTTLALVQRKLGKLPSKRHKLYWEAVGVLLNWRTDVDEPLDPDEALPQLEYVAYAMCDRGSQQLRRDDLLALLEGVRRDYPNIRPVQNRSPEEFLSHLERRTGLLVETGHKQHDGRPVPVYEFRHLTFQEYLAALALVEGRFPGHDPKNSLAERVAPLAGRLMKTKSHHELQVSENWREAIRLAVACCNDDDVDSTLLAMLTGRHRQRSVGQRERTSDPEMEGRAGKTPEPDSIVDEREIRPRAILAALCLADEPNVSQTTGLKILTACATQVRDEDGTGVERTGMDQAAMELGRSAWCDALKSELVREFQKRSWQSRGRVGGLYSMVDAGTMPNDEAERATWLQQRVARLKSGDVDSAVGAALAIMGAAFASTARVVPGLIEALTAMLKASPAESLAASWALFWLAEHCSWRPSDAAYSSFEQLLRERGTEGDTLYFLSLTFKFAPVKRAVTAVRPLLKHTNRRVRSGVLDTLSETSDPDAAETLRGLLQDPDAELRTSVVAALARINGDQVVGLLLSRDFDGFAPWLDPRTPITTDRVKEAAKKLKVSAAKIREHYEAIASDFGLSLGWKTRRG